MILAQVSWLMMSFSALSVLFDRAHQLVLRSWLPVVTFDTIGNLLASSCLLCCSPGLVAFGGKLLHSFVVQGFRRRRIVFRLAMPFKLLGRGLV